MASSERAIWTIAYRKPTGPWFQRVDLQLTWHQAVYLVGDLGELRPDLEIYATTTKANDDQALEDAKHNTCLLAQDYAEDAYNILTYSKRGKGKRVAVKDTGKLDPRLTIMDADEAKAKWSAGAR